MKVTLDLTDEDVVMLARLGRCISVGDGVAEDNARRAIVHMALSAIAAVKSRDQKAPLSWMGPYDREALVLMFGRGWLP